MDCVVEAHAFSSVFISSTGLAADGVVRLHRIHRPVFAACFTTGGAGLSFAKAGVQFCND
jgi:hypothetical protein